ncbi:cyclase family protein [Methanosarcina sp.]|jgi:arylformamidase|uniref:cyclase family protein n=1 Tax=Methanosarcina sp. TaxID=2213 RepID=UPI002C19B59B|nr:cyclase family protein [Methanosarcina sp.]HOW14790.1 cyclase family protein [Methanosarcina sp.]
MFPPENMPFKGRIIDITIPISPSTPIFPGDPEPSIESVCTIEKDGCAVSRLSFGSHTGTHVDAPSHVLKNGLLVDSLNLENLLGRAVVLDFSRINGELTDFILDKAYNDLKNTDHVSILLLKTKPSLNYKNNSRVSGLQAGESNKGIELEEPPENSVYLDSGAADWIVRKGFKTIGIDSFSVDSLSSENLPAHQILLSNNVNIVECLDLKSVEAGIYFFLCLPLKIEGCDGAPARALLISEY